MTTNSKLKKTWDAVAETYHEDDFLQPDQIVHFKFLSKNIKNIKGKKIVEVGCGSGAASGHLAKLGAEVTLVDISPASLDFARSYFKRHNLKGTFSLQDAFKMNFKPNSFDVVWNSGVIEHFSDEQKIDMISKMWKLVKPGGQLILTVPNAWDIPFMLAKQLLILRKKWAFGEEDDLTITRLKKFAYKAGVKKYKIYAYNPIVGWWFFPFGKEITNLLRLNSLKLHSKHSPFGHVLTLIAQK